MADELNNESEELLHGGKVMSLFDHLGELRQRILYSLISVLIFFCISVYFSHQIIDFLKQPLVSALPNVEGGKVLHFTGPLDVFLTSLKVAFLSSVVMACPVWIYQFWRFVEPALYKNERKFILPFIMLSVGLFLSGIIFSYCLILPMALDFLLSLGQEVSTPIITITDYISLLTLMIFGFGIVFEAPLFLILLGLLGLVDDQMLNKARRYVIVGILFVGALLTPPDPMSQIGMAIPLYIMYEISIIVIRVLTKGRKSEFEQNSKAMAATK